MRFHPEGPSIPDLLLNRCDAGRVVFLCGAGVSIPSGMPDFTDLTKYVVDFFDPPYDSEIMENFRPGIPDINSESRSATSIPLDQIFNLLQLEYGKDEVNALVTKRLSKILDSKTAGHHHNLIKRISSSQNGVPQIVTTNFDRLFETEQNEKILKQYVPPNFPELDYGSSIEGITYLHGRLVEEKSKSHPYVLSSADFGRAYLSEGWATKFIRNLLERYTVVLLGYKAEDPPVKYLLQGLNHDGQYDRSKIYAFDRGLPEKIEANWRDRGVTAIAYSTYSELWKSMEAWAVRADDPRKWRASIISKSQQDPKNLAPYERGQVAHVLRTAQGARLFSEAIPAPHPEWLCVMDTDVRSADQSSSYGDDKEIFEPSDAYGLDDDIKDISKHDQRQGVRNDNLLEWRAEDDNPHAFHRLGGQQERGFESTPIRLGHLINWISKSINSPIIAWWAIKQSGLHPRILQQLKAKVEQSEDLNNIARRTWNIIFEYHNDPRSVHWNGEWFAFEKDIKKDGWTWSNLRKFRKITNPRLTVSPPSGLGKSKPPSASWDEIRFSELGHWEVTFLEKYDEHLEIPDDILKQVFGILAEQLHTASGLLIDIENSYVNTPTFYPARNAITNSHLNTVTKAMEWLIELFDRVCLLWPEFAKAHSKIWLETNFLFFKKLKIYALNKNNIFNARSAEKEILSLNVLTFWDTNLTRELLFLLVDRWHEFSQISRNKLFSRILNGPPKPDHWEDNSFHELRDRYAARYGRYLELNGCKITPAQSKKLEKLVSEISKWSDGWAESVVFENSHQVSWIETDEKPDILLHVTDSEVIPRALKALSHDFKSFVDKRPFNGLVRCNPRKALSALKIAGRDNIYPHGFWSAMVNELSDNISPRLKKALMHRICKLPLNIISELGTTLGKWLETNFTKLLKHDKDSALKLYDHIVAGISSGDADTLKSSIGEVSIDRRVIQRSRRTYEHATTSPVGLCTIAIFKFIHEQKHNFELLIPDYIKSRIENLFSVSAEGADHAIAIAMRNLNLIMRIDPSWAEERLVLMLEFENPFSEPAWSGFLNSRNEPELRLFLIIKHLMLKIFPWIENLSWDRDISMVATQWIGSMRFYYPDLPHGLSRGEMRSIIRAMSDDTRNKFISLLIHIGQTNENGWSKYVIPLIEQDWPRERLYRTSASIRAWIGMLDSTSGSFPEVYKSVKDFLVSAQINEHIFYMFTQQSMGEKPLIERFPEEILDLINTVTPNFLSSTHYELPKLLGIIIEHKPSLISDASYLRLIDLVEKS